MVEPSAIAMGWSFFGPLMTQMVTSMQEFDERELATVRRFLLAMTEVVTASRRNRDSAVATGSSPTSKHRKPSRLKAPGDRAPERPEG